MELGIIIVLSVLLIVQYIINAVNNHKLINKVMSGNYGNYIQAETFKDQRNQMSGFSVPLPQDEGIDELEQLNRILQPPF